MSADADDDETEVKVTEVTEEPINWANMEPWATRTLNGIRSVPPAYRKMFLERALRDFCLMCGYERHPRAAQCPCIAKEVQ